MINLKNRLAARRGFTLVELLIVIIIIGILAGMMMLTTGAATDKAEAVKIVNNLRNLKAAALMYYTDTNSWLPVDTDGLDTTGIASLERYADRSIDTDAYGKVVVLSNDSGRMYIGFSGGSKLSDPGIREKLDQVARDSGVYSDNGANFYTKDETQAVMNMK